MKYQAVILLVPFLAFSTFAQQLPPVRYVDGAPACPSDTDLRNIETRLSSRVVRASNETSLRMEQQRAVQCRMSATARYGDADWKRLRAVVRGDE
jgi:hypothetical protein